MIYDEPRTDYKLSDYVLFLKNRSNNCIRHGRDLKNYDDQSYMYLKDFFFFIF